MCLSSCVFTRCTCMYVLFWKVVPKFGTPDSTRISYVVQRFFTRAIYKHAGIPYMDYGNRLGLQTSEYRIVYYNLVMCYKIYHNLTTSSPNLSGHTTSEVILVSCDLNVYPIIHFEHTFSPNMLSPYGTIYLKMLSRH